MESVTPDQIPNVESMLHAGLERAGKGHLDPGIELGSTDGGWLMRTEAPARWRYVYDGEIGRGGMGVVYRVLDTDLHRRLAMKVSSLGSDAIDALSPPGEPTLLERFLEEAQITGQLDHPGVVPLHELGIDPQGRVYFTMRYVKGDELLRIFEHARAGTDGWNQERVLNALVRVCEALGFAHSKGVLHRDLKPSNIMVGSFGEVYVMDWGVAKVLGRDRSRVTEDREEDGAEDVVRTRRAEGLQDDPTHTQHGTVFGTPAYMSPEQARGEIETLDGRADVYAVGALLYHWLAGCAPYCENEAHAPLPTRLHWLLDGPPRPVRKLAPKTDPELAAICEKAMARDANDRYADMEALAADLRSFVAGRPVAAQPLGSAGRAVRWARKNLYAVAMLVAVLVGSAYGIARLSSLSTTLVHQSAIDSAAMKARMLEDVNSLYSSDVVARIDRDVVDVTHAYSKVAHAIPIPATFLTVLGERISKDHSGVRVRQYSDYPFRFRERWNLDDFEKRALVELRADPSVPVTSFEDVEGKPVLRYAVGRIMEASCVQCHNSDPDSTKHDWKVGDVRGVLEIVRPLDQDVARIRSGLSGTLVIVVAIVGGLMMLSAAGIVRSARKVGTTQA